MPCLCKRSGRHRLCNRSVHLICGPPEGEEGYGQYVTCFPCLETNDGTKKRPLWNWKSIQSREFTPVIKQSFDGEIWWELCLPSVFGVVFKGKRDEKYTGLCRKDHSTIKRHKDRWHSMPGSVNCTILPSLSLEIAALRKKYEGESKYQAKKE